MKCLNCGTENPYGMKFCQECGNSLAKAEGKLTCPNCDHTNRVGIRFCEECGAELKLPVLTPTQVKCPVCNHINRAGVQFCEECGADLKIVRAPLRAIKAPLIKRLNFRKIATVLLALAAVAILLVVVIDRLRFSVTKGEAKDMAVSAIQVSYPELSKITPKITEYTDEAGNRIVTYSYTKQVDAQLEAGNTTQFTYGAVVTVNRNTGDIQVISVR